MTDGNYKELQVWCQSNKHHPDYRKNVELRNEATRIRARITCFKNEIRKSMFILEACKEEHSIKRWKGIIGAYKDQRNIEQKLFDNLPNFNS